MKVQWIKPEATLATERDEVIVCIPVYGGHEHFVSCLQSVLAHTPARTKIVIADDASPDPSSAEFVRGLDGGESGDHELFYLRREHNLGFPANVNGVFELAAPADVVVLNSDCVVSKGWLEGLREAARVDSRVATATTLTNHGSVASVPHRGRPMPELPPGWSLDDAAAAVRQRSLRIRPRLPTAIGHCMYVRRSALELVGAFDLAFSPGYGEEVDFSQRCVRSGLCHVLADDVLVFHRGGISFAGNGRRSAVQHEHERLIAERHPYFHDAVKLLEDDATGPLARALSAARRALIGLSVAIDARILTGPMTGTQLHVLELIAALSRAASLRITAIVPEDLSAYAALAFDRMPDVKLLTREQAADGELDRCDIVHRPYQVNNDDDLAFLAGLGERLIVTHQDLIGYHNPSYFRDFSGWQGYRRITRSALAVADRVVFFSEHARTDALAEDLVEPGRASVVHIGVDHSFNKAVEEPVAPNGAAPVADGAQAILCIGTDFRHKNRTFALRVLEQLQKRHNWDGYLLLVGPRVALGSSIPDEAEILGSDRRLADRVLNLGPVSEAEKAWLFGHAALAFYPTVHEGFGLIPFEAADHGVACMWAEGTSLSELLPDDAAGIVPWDPELTAAQALDLMRDEQARKRNVAAIREAGSRLSWDATASRLLELYDATCNESARPGSTLERMHGLMQGLLTEDAMRLIGPGGALPADVARPLLALATHPQIGAPVFGAIRVGYRASYRLRRRRRANGGKRS